MTALLLPTLDDNAAPDELREALRHLSAEAGRMLRVDHLGRVNPEWVAHHERIDLLLDALVGR